MINVPHLADRGTPGHTNTRSDVSLWLQETSSCLVTSSLLLSVWWWWMLMNCCCAVDGMMKHIVGPPPVYHHPFGGSGMIVDLIPWVSDGTQEHISHDVTGKRLFFHFLRLLVSFHFFLVFFSIPHFCFLFLLPSSLLSPSSVASFSFAVSSCLCFHSIPPSSQHSSYCSSSLLFSPAGLWLLSHFSAIVCKHFCVRGRDQRKTGGVLWGRLCSRTASSSEFVEADEKHSWKCETFRWDLLTLRLFKHCQCPAGTWKLSDSAIVSGQLTRALIPSQTHCCTAVQTQRCQRPAAGAASRGVQLQVHRPLLE